MTVTASWPTDLGTHSFEVKPSSVLYRQGQPIQTIFLVVSGIVQAISRDRGDEVPVAFRTAGSVLGAVPALLGHQHIATARTWTTCVLSSVDVVTFHDLRQTNARVARWLQALLAQEARDYFVRARMFMQEGMEKRFEYLLADLMRIAGELRPDGTLVLRLPTTVEELAGMLGTRRESLSRLLLRLEGQGTIMRKDRWIVVPGTSSYMAFLKPLTPVSTGSDSGQAAASAWKRSD